MSVYQNDSYCSDLPLFVCYLLCVSYGGFLNQPEMTRWKPKTKTLLFYQKTSICYLSFPDSNSGEFLFQPFKLSSDVSGRCGDFSLTVWWRARLKGGQAGKIKQLFWCFVWLWWKAKVYHCFTTATLECRGCFQPCTCSSGLNRWMSCSLKMYQKSCRGC